MGTVDEFWELRQTAARSETHLAIQMAASQYPSSLANTSAFDSNVTATVPYSAAI
jgi:hypothetical protein